MGTKKHVENDIGGHLERKNINIGQEGTPISMPRDGGGAKKNVKTR
jgi:hypothetical protein